MPSSDAIIPPPCAPFGRAPSAADLDHLARRTLASIPHPFANHLPDIVFQVQEFPPEDVLADMQAQSPFDITGLYQGLPVGERHGSLATDMIFLYRQPLLAQWCESGEPLEDIVIHLIVHEIGHHFGLSDEDMERMEQNV